MKTFNVTLFCGFCLRIFIPFKVPPIKYKCIGSLIQYYVMENADIIGIAIFYEITPVLIN